VALEFEVAIGQVLDAEFSVLPLVSIDPLSLNAEEISFQSNPDPDLRTFSLLEVKTKLEPGHRESFSC
jgi:hypothetical protein